MAPPQRTAAADAFGAALLDVLDGGDGLHIVERDDGFTETMPAGLYFRDPADWPPRQRTALNELSGIILDVGAGAGRHALHLQARGAHVVALDTSPGAVEVCRRRGVHETFLGSVHEFASTDPEPFDAAILMGHNLGVLASEHEAGSFSTRCAGCCRRMGS